MVEQQSEREYLERRRRRCEENARNAADPGIAKIHQQFADHYAARLKGEIGRQRPNS